MRFGRPPPPGALGGGGGPGRFERPSLRRRGDGGPLRFSCGDGCVRQNPPVDQRYDIVCFSEVRWRVALASAINLLNSSLSLRRLVMLFGFRIYMVCGTGLHI